MIGTTINGKYRLLSELGRGAMGVVYRAEQLDIDGQAQRLVAVKTLKPEFSQDLDFARRFRREVGIAIQLRSPHALTVYDSGRDEIGQLYYVMEFMPQTLKEFLQAQGGQLPVEQAVAIIGQLCEALSEAHSLPEPVVHRDIKPANIFIEHRGRRAVVKLGDFGIAKVLNELTTVLTHTGRASPGTPRYMAPEQWIGQKVDGRTDLYSLGVLLYEMVSGQPPFVGSMQALMGQHLQVSPPSLPETVPPGVRRVVEKLLAKKRDERPADALSVQVALEAALSREEQRTVILKGPESLAVTAEVPGPLVREPQESLEQQPTFMLAGETEEHKDPPLSPAGTADMPPPEREQLFASPPPVALSPVPFTTPEGEPVLHGVVGTEVGVGDEHAPLSVREANEQAVQAAAESPVEAPSDTDHREPQVNNFSPVAVGAGSEARKDREAEQGLWFAEFHVDLRNEQLWLGQQIIALPPRVFALLRYLLERPGQLVTKAELFQSLWPGIAVGDAVLTVAIGELRKILGDTPQTPRFIETVHRRGYRFVAPMTNASAIAATSIEAGQERATTPPKDRLSSSQIVERGEQLRQLQHAWERAQQGERQVMFVTGEAGSGKTALVDTFIEAITYGNKLWFGHGQCIEHYGTGEAYLPVLDVLGQLCRGSEGSQLVNLLRRQAPTWLGQLPGVLEPAEMETLQQLTSGVTRERMLREMAETLEALSTHQPMVVVLEDLHWSDASTVDLLAFIARRRQPARLLVLGTYRPVELILREHPLKRLKQELQVHGHCREVSVSLLTRVGVEQYLNRRFPQHNFPINLGGLLFARTEGNPLFLVTLLQDWERQGIIAEVQGQWRIQGELEEIASQVPQSLQQLVEQQLERLSPAVCHVLEVASLAGKEFSAALVAAGMETSVVEVESECESLARSNYLVQRHGTAEWPDGTVATCYGFLHSFYREVLVGRVPAARRVQLYRRLAERLETAYRDHTPDIAAELALYFEEGRNYAKAIPYRQQTTERALQRHAYVEAARHASHGLELLKTQPATPERDDQELSLLMMLGLSIGMTETFSGPVVLGVYTRALELCQRTNAPVQLFHVLRIFYLIRAELGEACELGKQLLVMADQAQDPTLRLEAHRALGEIYYWRGAFSEAEHHLAQANALYERHRHEVRSLLYGEDPGAISRGFLSLVLWTLGLPDQAQQRMQEALKLADELTHPPTQVVVFCVAAALSKLCREPHKVNEYAKAIITLAGQYELHFYAALGKIYRGWSLAEQGQKKEGILQIQEGIAFQQETGTKLGLPYWFSLLAEAYTAAGQLDEGYTAITTALTLAEQTDERNAEAEFYRLQGELKLHAIPHGRQGVKQTKKKLKLSTKVREAEECFQRSLAVARRQGTKMLELRTALSLGRLWQRVGKKKEAHQLLAEIYSSFTEGFETKDLQEAKLLLESLAVL